MTLEQKAKELVDKFHAHTKDIGTTKAHSRVCALMTCNEVIAEIEDLQQNCDMEFPKALEYWANVKKEIEKP
jgi:hypothetical protein